jgi:pyruvate kinase
MWRPAQLQESYDSIETLIAKLDEISEELANVELCHAHHLERLHHVQRASGLNLLHYLQLRRHDLRPLQLALAVRGLSSLGRSESHVWDNVQAVRAALKCLGGAHQIAPTAPQQSTLPEAPTLLDRQTEVLLGPTPAKRRVRIMVTMPSEAASDYELVRKLVQSGMDCMRINCAHDDTSTWAAMIDHLRRAEAEFGRRVLLMMDLPGPKLRTGAIASGPEVIKWRPERDLMGHVVEPAHIWLTPADSP